MASARGCFKNGCLGCLGFIVLILLIVGVTALVAWNDSKNSTPVDQVFAPLAPLAPLEPLEPLESDEGPLMLGYGGKVVLNMAQGEFYIHSAEPGEGLRIEAVYDDEIYDLTQEFITLPDSTWQYELEFQRTGGGMRSFLQSVFSKGPSAQIKIYLPPEIPLELVSDISKGGFESDLGGLWLTAVDFNVHQGGFELEISEPLKEPLRSFRIKSSMGGFSADGLGNASPKVLEVTCSMGGAEVDLSGAWQNDCDVNLSIKMGGMAVIIPRDIKVLRGAAEIESMTAADVEVGEPVLRLHTRAHYGEIEVVH